MDLILQLLLLVWKPPKCHLYWPPQCLLSIEFSLCSHNLCNVILFILRQYALLDLCRRQGISWFSYTISSREYLITFHIIAAILFHSTQLSYIVNLPVANCSQAAGWWNGQLTNMAGVSPCHCWKPQLSVPIWPGYDLHQLEALYLSLSGLYLHLLMVTS